MLKRGKNYDDGLREAVKKNKKKSYFSKLWREGGGQGQVRNLIQYFYSFEAKITYNLYSLE